MTRRDATRQLASFLAASPLLRSETKPEDMINVFDFEPFFKSNVTQPAYDYVTGGGWDEWTLRRNREMFQKIIFRPRFFREVDKLDLSTTVFGQKLNFPILVAPTGTHAVVHPEGEVATVRGAGAAGAHMVISTSHSMPLEKIAAAARAPIWFQLYTGPDHESTKERVLDAVDRGCKAVMVTADAPYNAPREKDFRNKLRRDLPAAMGPPRRQRTDDAPPPANPFNLGLRFQATLNWKFVETLAGYAKVPVLVKGILTPEDARLALEHGAAGIVVSNHGGRYLDGDPSTIEVLPDIVAAVQGKVPVLIDGGFRRGTDVLKALAVGAKAVMVGRPPLIGLGAFGAAGVQRVMEILRNELAWAMGLAGRRSIAEIDKSLIQIDH